MQQKSFLFLCCVLCVLSHGCQSQTIPMTKIEKNGMVVNWQFEGEYLAVQMSAPSDGWVAIGFNTADGLSGTNLIMAAVSDAKTLLSDRYIVAPGDHRSIEDLGGIPSLLLDTGLEKSGTTTISFKIRTEASDKYHFDLSPGKVFHLLLAYSLEDDFMHHSVMRTSVKITL
jgi:DOMON domain